MNSICLDTWWWDLHLSAVFTRSFIQNGIRTVYCRARTACGNEISGAGNVEKSLKFINCHVCLGNRLSHIYQSLNGVNTFMKVGGQTFHLDYKVNSPIVH